VVGTWSRPTPIGQVGITERSHCVRLGRRWLWVTNQKVANLSYLDFFASLQKCQLLGQALRSFQLSAPTGWASAP